jgi:pilus assembly protein Flp/PilA
VKIRNSEKGQGMVEYALILVFVAIVVIVLAALLGSTLGKNRVDNSVNYMVAEYYSVGHPNNSLKITQEVGSEDDVCEKEVVFQDLAFKLKTCRFEKKLR